MTTTKKTLDPIKTNVSAAKLRFWRTNLFSDVFLENDIGRTFKEWEEDDRLETIFQQFLNHAHDSLDLEDLRARNENDTVKVVEEILQLLGWCKSNKDRRDVILSETVFHEEVTIIKDGFEATIKRAYRPDSIIIDKSGQRKSVNPSRGVYDLDAATRFTLVPVEVKYWGRLAAEDTNGKYKIDKSKDNDKDKLNLKPNQQIQKYMKILKKDWGILTDGATWRLFNLGESNGEDIFFEFRFDLWVEEVQRHLLSSNRSNPRHIFDGFKYLYFFFGRESFSLKRNGFVDRVFQETQKYVRDLDKELATPFIDAMTIACNAYRRAMGSEAAKANRELILNVCESHIFNILFIRSCETSGVLKAKDPPYSNYCLESLIESVGAFNPQHGIDNVEELNESFKDFFDHSYDFNPDNDDLYHRLLMTYDVVREGIGKDFVGFKESFFDEDQSMFIKKFSIRNDDFVRILFTLNYDRESSYTDREGRRRFRLFAFNVIKPRQLGSVYESFLEYDLKIAETDSAFLKGCWSPQDLNSRKFLELKRESKKAIPVAQQGTFYFEHAQANLRKQTGSYYTPDFVVEKIVNEVVSPLTTGKKYKELLNLKICDPSMGSGHFLVEAMKQLADAYEEAYARENSDYLESDRRVILRQVLEGSIFGVDINPRAVKLAKMSLWLATAYAGKELEYLDDQIKCGDSLISEKKFAENAFDWNLEFKNVFSKKGFDAIVGNPPYGVSINDEEAKRRLKTYPTLGYKADSYLYFLLHSMRLVKSEGFVGLVLPNTICDLESLTAFRKDILEKHELVSIFESGMAFKDAVVDTIVPVFKNTAPKDLNSTIIIRDSVRYRRQQASFLSNELCKIDYRNAEGSTSAIKDVISRSAKFGDFMTISAGAILYEKGKGTPPQSARDMQEKKHTVTGKQPRGWRPLIRGKHIDRYAIPVTDEFVSYGEWLAAPRSPELFKGTRIAMRRTDDVLRATILSHNEVCVKSCHILRLKDKKSAYSYEFILGILNSKIIQRIFEYQNPQMVGKTFAEVKVIYVERLPFPDLTRLRKTSQSVERLEALVKKRLKAKGAETSSLEEEIDELVADLFELSRDERNSFFKEKKPALLQKSA